MSIKTLTRADLAEMLHREVGLSRSESAEMVNNILELISAAAVDGQSIKLSSFGTFLVRSKRQRIGRNPKTGVEVPITPRRVMVFRPSQIMKNIVNGLAPGEDDVG
jgi:integration host factor subunit alpha